MTDFFKSEPKHVETSANQASISGAPVRNAASKNGLGWVKSQRRECEGFEPGNKKIPFRESTPGPGEEKPNLNLVVTKLNIK